MSEGPFDATSIQARITAEVLRIQSALLEWSAEPSNADFDTTIVESLVETLDAHARELLRAVVDTNLIHEYANRLRHIGSALIQNAEQRSFLSDPYSDERLRALSESRGEYIVRKHSLTPDDQETEILRAIEEIRLDVSEEAQAWHRWKAQILLRIESRFEARYCHWMAEAIDRVRGPKDHVICYGHTVDSDALKAILDLENREWMTKITAIFGSSPKSVMVGEAL